MLNVQIVGQFEIMRILCVYSVEQYASIAQPLPAFSDIPFGISYIATVLKKIGHTVRILVCTPHPNSLERIIETIHNDAPQLLCLSAVTSQYPRIEKIAACAKHADPKLRIIIGGHHATLNPEATIKKPFFDALCIGEGEESVPIYAGQMAQGKQPTGINNLWIKNERTRTVEKNAKATFIQNLDGLPFVDRSLWNDLIVNKSRMHTVLVGRGCPNKCSYCSNHMLRRTGIGKYVRYRSAKNIVEELREICDNYNDVSCIHLEAETLSINIEYTFVLCSALEAFNRNRAQPISFGANLSMTPSVIDNRDLVTALKRANFDFINIGLESGSERIRNEIMRRPKYSNSDIINFCTLVKESGIYINLFVLMGVPGERYHDYKQTIECVRRCEPEHTFVSIFYPYPGTDLYNTAKRQKLITDDIVNPELERRIATLDLPGFSRKQIQKEYIIFAYRVYRGKKSVLSIAVRVLHAYISTRTLLSRFYRCAVRHPIMRMAQKKFARMSK